MAVDQHFDREGTAAEMNDPQADAVSRQYQKYRYPEPIQDLEAWLQKNWRPHASTGCPSSAAIDGRNRRITSSASIMSC